MEETEEKTFTSASEILKDPAEREFLEEVFARFPQESKVITYGKRRQYFTLNNQKAVAAENKGKPFITILKKDLLNETTSNTTE